MGSICSQCGVDNRDTAQRCKACGTALGAEACEIYTDVPGVLTTDPRKVPDAQLMASVSCDEMLELASLGACVQQHAVKPPALLIIGEVVRLQARLQATLAQALAG